MSGSCSMPIKNTFESKMQYRIKRSAGSVFVISDFLDITDRDQVARVLRILIKKEVIIKLGAGVFARTKVSQITGKPIPEKDLRTLAIGAMKKLGVKVRQTKMERFYQQGASLQVPTGLLLGVNKRVNRVLGYNEQYVSFKYIP